MAGTVTHGLTRSPTWVSWTSMLARCRDPNNASWSNYGGKGIRVCERWLKLESFAEDMGLRPAGHQIDRVDNDKDYEPGNCKWASTHDQARNRSTNHYIEFEGERLTLTDWGIRLGIPRTCLDNRVRDWGIARALTTPYPAPRGKKKELGTWAA